VRFKPINLVEKLHLVSWLANMHRDEIIVIFDVQEVCPCHLYGHTRI
jgi:hypothetical protein